MISGLCKNPENESGLEQTWNETGNDYLENGGEVFFQL